MLRLMRPAQVLRERRPATRAAAAAAAAADEYRCCMCLHVKTGTLLLGLWQVWVQLFVVSFLLAVVINPNLLDCMRSSGKQLQQHDSLATTTATTTTTTAAAAIGTHPHKQLRRQDHVLLLLIGIVSLLLALLMVTGALKERAKYIMPYFCMQLFDFIINCLTVVGYFSYLPDVKHWLANHHWPHDTEARRFLLGLDDATLGFLMLIVCMLYLMLKAYLLGMVWACYKYLVRKENNQLDAAGCLSDGDWESAAALLMTPHGGVCDSADADAAAAAAGLLPPKYEDALKAPANLNAPPPYFPGNANRFG